MTPDDGLWHFTAGDPTFLGWTTFAAYLLAAVLAWHAGRVSRQDANLFREGHAPEAVRQDRLAVWWLCMAVLMTVLGLNKELDLQRLVGEWGKVAALSQGWYADRRMVQIAFIIVLLLLTAGAAVTMFRFFRIVWDRIALAIAGIALIIAYVLLRAALIHVMRDAMPEIIVSTMWVLELLGVMLVIWSAARALRTGGLPRI